jgi:hypothetical protein
MHALLALNWEPQIRGVIIIIISVSVLCGSVYLILGTNLGARLGFLLSLSALSGWMLLMSIVWWSFGIGLKGDDVSWKAMKGETILLDSNAVRETGVVKLDAPLPSSTDDPVAAAAAIDASLLGNGWQKIDATDKTYGPAASSAGVFVEDDGAHKAGTYQVVNVFDKGGERYPKISDEIDFTAFLHKPRWNLVEVATLLPQRTEPGRAPARAEIDTTQPHFYVYMIRNLGNKRVPAAEIAFGSAIVFFSTCYLLHTRDRRVLLNRSKGLAVPTGA